MTITLPDLEQPAVDEAIGQLIADLEFARDYIDKHGLAKNHFFSVLDNATCADGAIMRGIGRGAMDSPRRHRALYALAMTLGADLSEGPQQAVYAFNDSSEKSDVIGLFNTTIDSLRS